MAAGHNALRRSGPGHKHALDWRYGTNGLSRSVGRLAWVRYPFIALSNLLRGALADAIDGDWCSMTEAKQLRFAGPNITTPAGQQTTGNYSRHAFWFATSAVDPARVKTAAFGWGTFMVARKCVLAGVVAAELVLVGGFVISGG